MSGWECIAGSQQHAEVRFTLVGLVASPEFQECVTIVELLHKKCPERYPKPFIRPMLEFDWLEYLIKAQRTYGDKLWHLDKPFIIYANDEQLGGDRELDQYVSQWYQVHTDKDFYCLSQKGIADMYEKYIELGRKFIFLSVSKNKKSIGHMIFMLYYDIVPKTCKNFIRKCKRKRNGYRGTHIHRIMRNSWIQCADFTLPLDSMSNENYVVPHNRRGVISMCNNGPHKDNKTQFFITLGSTPWMDYRYVAFGQLMQGEYVLRTLENLPAIMESPCDELTICNCGEITTDDTALAKNIIKVSKYIDDRSSKSSVDLLDLRDAPSIILEDNYRKLKYCYFDDNLSHLPMMNLTSCLISEPSLLSYMHGHKVEVEMSEIENESDMYGKHAGLLLATDQFFYEQIKELISSQAIEYLHSLSKLSEIDQSYEHNIFDGAESEHEGHTTRRTSKISITLASPEKELAAGKSLKAEHSSKLLKSSLSIKSVKSTRSSKSKVEFTPSTVDVPQAKDKTD